MTASDSDHVDFHTLKSRKDGGEWIIGCQDTGQVVAVPEVGMTAIRLLVAGHSIDDTRRELRAATQRDVDVRTFVEGLAASGLVSAIGDRRFPQPLVKVTLPSVRPHHVRWALNPLLHAAVLALVMAGVALVAIRPQILPAWHFMVWSEYGTFVLATQSLVAWTLIFVHEAAHLLTARAAGVPGRVRLGTRLHFLVAQTEVSGIWLGRRRERLTVYLSGLAVDGGIASACLLAIAAGADSPLLPVIVLTLLYTFANQCLVFMRTDLYFVLQDLTGCRNLYGDSGAYLRHVMARLLRRHHIDPLASLRGAERRALRIYSVVQVTGTAVCLVVAFHLFRDVTWRLVSRSVTVLMDWPGFLPGIDALATFAVVAGLQLLWARLWWRRHRERVRTVATSAVRPLMSR